MYTLHVRLLALLCAGVLACGAPGNGRAETVLLYSASGAQAADALIADYYDGSGRWRECDAPSCKVANSDWGTDAATGTMYLRWASTNDPRTEQILASLIPTSVQYPSPCMASHCGYWSDTAAWDAVALMRIYQATGNIAAFNRAKAAYAFVEESTAYRSGACPQIPYQQPAASGSQVKTLETLANEIKASLLFYRTTGDRHYLEVAQTQYGNARAFFFDGREQLYTVHVLDDGKTCRPMAGRYFASVNGLMMWNGWELAQATGNAAFAEEATANAAAVARDLSDGNGIFTDAAGDNDIAEPLVEGMLELAKSGDAIALDWIRHNADAALGARGADGSFARFFDGPPQPAPSIWESNGGFAIEIAAAALDPGGTSNVLESWTNARIDVAALRTLPATFMVDGSAFAITGTMNAACMRHHLRVSIDGVPIPDRAGLWQNPSMQEREPVVFAWRWAAPGKHTVTIDSDDAADAISFSTYVLR